MSTLSDEIRTAPVEVTCPGCFHPRTWEANAPCPICKYIANANRSAALLPVETQLGQYVIGEKLGQGGFGITYRGFDLKLHMKVAIKEYYPSDFVGRSVDQKTVILNALEHENLFAYGLKAFLQEARTLAQLKHPHVVRVLNYFEMNGTAYLVMDYYEGENLMTYLKQQPGGCLPWRQAVRLLLPVLEGLQKVHQAGFIHRDFKPGNLYLTKRDGLILLDFGAARQVTSNHSKSIPIYSNGYAPYEQYLEGNFSRQDSWTDVYGAGATLYFMLTAQRPPSASDRKQASQSKKPDPLKPARHFIPDLPPVLDVILGRALAVEPEQRLQVVMELKQQLETVLAEEENGRKKISKDKDYSQVMMICTVITALIAAATFALKYFEELREQESTAWQLAEKCGTAECFRGYLEEYPKGRYAKIAQAQLEPAPKPPVLMPEKPELTPQPISQPAPPAPPNKLTDADADRQRLDLQLVVAKKRLDKPNVKAARLALEDAKPLDHEGRVEQFRQEQTQIFAAAARKSLKQNKRGVARRIVDDLGQWDPQSAEYQELKARLK